MLVVKNVAISRGKAQNRNSSQKFEKIAICRGNRQITLFLVETTKYHNSAPTVTNIRPCLAPVSQETPVEKE